MSQFYTGWLLLSATQESLPKTGVPFWITLLVVLAVFAAPFTLGSLIARGLKMKEVAFKMGLILFTCTLGLMPFCWQALEGQVEHYQYEQNEVVWKEINKRNQVTDSGVEKLKKQLPDCEIVQ